MQSFLNVFTVTTAQYYVQRLHTDNIDFSKYLASATTQLSRILSLALSELSLLRFLCFCDQPKLSTLFKVYNSRKQQLAPAEFDLRPDQQCHPHIPNNHWFKLFYTQVFYDYMRINICSRSN